MLNSKTVFILGAGASKEVGLPVGGELKSTISRKLDLRFSGYDMIGKGDHVILNILQQEYRGAVNDYLQACWKIRDGIVLSDSIDDFIDAHQHDERIRICGKLAIARSILEAEQRSKLYFERNHVNDSINFSDVTDTWYPRFYSLITKHVQKSQLGSVFDNVTIISFNYDRCLEHFLVHAFKTNYHISFEEADDLVRQLKILRPYGTVGLYFGMFKQQFGIPNRSVEFGFKGLHSVNTITSNIRTYTEQISDEKELKEIRQAVHEAKTLVFLGCAFHQNNMDLLKDDAFPTKTERFFSTRKGISDNDLPVIWNQLGAMQGGGILYQRQPSHMFFSQECKDLFVEYQKSLSQ